MPDPKWLDRQARAIEENSKTWPAWMTRDYVAPLTRMSKLNQPIIIRARCLRDGDPDELLRFADTGPHVAWVEGKAMDCYDKNTGRSDAEAIGSLVINLSYLDMPFTVEDVVLEDLA